MLFIGNSYTSVNNLPQMVQAVAASCGDTVTYRSSTPGGCTFRQHLDNASAELIRQGGWDYVVLQEQSQLPSFPFAQFMQESYPYAERLCNLVRQYNPQAEIFFYMTWGRRDGDTANAGSYEPLATYNGMDSLLRARYMMMAGDNGANIAPVGPVWHYIRDHYPDIELYGPDGSHPSLAGSYAAACTFYTVFFRKSPLAIADDCGTDAATARTLRECAKTVAFDSIGSWLFSMPAAAAYGSYEATAAGMECNLAVWPNPASDKVSVRLPRRRFSDCSLLLCDSRGNRVGQWTDIREDRFSIDVSGCSSGIYCLEVFMDGRIAETKKIVIARR